MKTFPSPLVLVEEFHLTFGHKVRMTPKMDEPARDLRIALIAEEVEELEEAYNTKDFIEVIDALADIIYVTYGAGLTHGLNLDAVMGVSNHISPNQVLKHAARNVPATPGFYEEPLEYYVPRIVTHFKNYSTQSHAGDAANSLVTLANLATNCFLLSWELGVDLDAILAEVQRSNMSKLGEDGLPILRADGKILKGPNFFVPNILAELELQGYKS